MIDLTGCKPFASGYNRHCFNHPDNPAHCLKVIRSANIEARYNRQSPIKRLLGKKRLNDNAQELRAHRQTAINALNSKGQNDLVWAHLPRFYGSVETSLGQANESELIRCANGDPAPTLEKLIQQTGLSPALQEAIDNFIDWLRATQILTRNLLPHNLVVSDRAGKQELFLVDGLGAPAVPAALSHLPGWSSHYIDRKVRRFRKRLAWEQESRGLSWEEFQHIG